MIDSELAPDFAPKISRLRLNSNLSNSLRFLCCLGNINPVQNPKIYTELIG